MTTQGWMWTADGAAVAVIAAAGIADWRRSRRRDLDSWGWVPWRGLQAAGLFAILALAILALKAG